MMNNHYFKNLDWLRAYAALAVIFFHLNFSFNGVSAFMPYWWLWVPVFFVISGFLITNILLSTKEKENYFSHFYFHRGLRILPLYFLCFFFAVLYWFLNGVDFSHIFWFIGFLQNWIIGLSPEHIWFPAIFSHSWTLAVEQQFYLIWPLLVRFLSIRALVLFSYGSILFSVLFRFYCIDTFPSLADYSTFSHLDTLLWGWLLAIFYQERKELKSILINNMFFVASCFIGYILFNNYLQLPYFWEKDIRTNMEEFPTLMLFFSPLCIFCVHYLLVAKNRMIKLIFSNAWIVYLWKISYGIYMFHLFILHLFDSTQIERFIGSNILIFYFWILEFFMDNGVDILRVAINWTVLSMIVFKIALILGLAHFSYKYYERWFLKYKSQHSS